MKKAVSVLLIVVIIIGGVYAFTKDSEVFDRFYPKESQQKRELQRVAKEIPQTLGNYVLYGRTPLNVEVRVVCDQFENTEMCQKTFSFEYREVNGNHGIFVQLEDVNTDVAALERRIATYIHSDKLGQYDIIRIEKHELGWFSDSKFDLVFTQEGTYKVNADGSESYTYPSKATGNNPVTQYFLKKYPPVPTD